MRTVNTKYSLSLSSYDELWKWSIANIANFWDLVWEETGIIGERGPSVRTHGPSLGQILIIEQQVVDSEALPADNPGWFVGSRLNWAENALWCRSPDKVAFLEAG